MKNQYQLTVTPDPWLVSITPNDPALETLSPMYPAISFPLSRIAKA